MGMLLGSLFLVSNSLWWVVLDGGREMRSGFGCHKNGRTQLHARTQVNIHDTSLIAIVFVFVLMIIA